METTVILIELSDSASESLKGYLAKHPEWDKNRLVSKAVEYWLSAFGSLTVVCESDWYGGALYFNGRHFRSLNELRSYAGLKGFESPIYAKDCELVGAVSGTQEANESEVLHLAGEDVAYVPCRDRLVKITF